MNYEDLFPKHRLNKSQFLIDLIELKKMRNSMRVVEYWVSLDNEGRMSNILKVFGSKPETQAKIKTVIYSFAEFMTKKDFVVVKKILGIHGHILEFVHAILNKPEPNFEIIQHFVMVAKSPRHYDPQIIRWFWKHVNPIIEHDSVMLRQFSDNCSNSINRWMMTQKRNKKYKYQLEEPSYVIFENTQIPSKLITIKKNKVSDTATPRQSRVYLAD
jgi:hypothetical protein